MPIISSRQVLTRQKNTINRRLTAAVQYLTDDEDVALTRTIECEGDGNDQNWTAQDEVIINQHADVLQGRIEERMLEIEIELAARVLDKGEGADDSELDQARLGITRKQIMRHQVRQLRTGTQIKAPVDVAVWLNRPKRRTAFGRILAISDAQAATYLAISENKAARLRELCDAAYTFEGTFAQVVGAVRQALDTVRG